MRWLAAFSIAVASSAFSADDRVHALIERVSQAREAAYAAALDELDLRAAQDPANAAALLDECRFVREFAWAEEATIERAAEDEERCDRDLTAEAFVRDPRVQLFRMEGLYGQRAIDEGEKLLNAAKGWSAADRAALYTRLSNSYRLINPNEAQRYARLALDNDPNSSLRLNVAERWIQLGAIHKAVDLIKSTPPKAWAELSTRRGAELLLRAEMPADAVRLLRTQSDASARVSTNPVLAKALGLSGQIDEARALYTKALGDDKMGWGNRSFVDYFQFENAHGTREQAAAAYEKLRDRGFNADPLARYRLALTARHPLAGWRWRDIPAVLAFLAMLAAVALSPALLIAPVHYRVLAKRLRGFVPSSGHWGFCEVWMALSIVLLMQILTPYVFAYDTLAATLSIGSPVGEENVSSPRSLAYVVLLMAPLTALFLSPILRGVDWRALFLGKARVANSIGLALAAFLLLRIVVVIYSKIYVSLGGGVAALGDVTTQAIQGLGATYGTWAAVLMVAGVVPLLEETVFRGIVLQGLARYVPFGVAAMLQAAVFAGLHESVVAMPVIFLIGLVTAWLVRRTGGLLAPIILHALNNASAYIVIIASTSLMDRV